MKTVLVSILLLLALAGVASSQPGQQHQTEPCDPTEWPYDCGSSSCQGQLWGISQFQIKPSTVYSGICLYRLCQWVNVEDGPDCLRCDPWAYTTC